MNISITLSSGVIAFVTVLWIISRKSKNRPRRPANWHPLDYQTEIIQDSIHLRGVIEKRHFYDKGGRKVSNVFDYVFVTQDKNYFIKISESTVSQQELERYVGRTVSIRGTLKRGPFDYEPRKLGPNDCIPQSREGKYLTIMKLQRK